MWTDEQFDQLEQDERTLTEEAVILMTLLLQTTKSDIEKELRSFYQQYGKDGVITYSDVRKWTSGIDHRRRLTVLLLFLADKFDELYDALTPQFTTFLTKVVQKEFDFFDVDLEDDILDAVWGVDEANWLNRLADDVELWNVNIANDLKRSFMRHDNVEDVVDKLNKRFMSIEKALFTLAITESTAVGSLARREIFKELGINKFQYYAREDERTCEVCGSLHGLVFPISSYEIGVNASPMHPRCRCWEVPIRD
jgi:SPP1 gp7 family putative phage head morphogenesis protein